MDARSLDGVRRPRVLLALTGSVATVKWPQLVAAVSEFADVRVVCSKHGEHFFRVAKDYDGAGYAAAEAAGYTAGPPLLWRDTDEWADYTSVKADPVQHIELRKWADVVLVAPLSANTLSNIASGACPGLLTCVLRAWPFKAATGRSGRSSSSGGGSTAAVASGVDRDAARVVAKPVVVAPAMNTAMWEHPVTAGHISVLQSWGVHVVPPAAKVLACGDMGTGAMADVADIVAVVKGALQGQEAPQTPIRCAPEGPKEWDGADYGLLLASASCFAYVLFVGWAMARISR